MTPEAKAIELYNNYYQLAESINCTDYENAIKAEQFNDELGSDVLIFWNELAKESALIVVNQMLQLGWNLPHYENKTGIEYWTEVKEEIEKL